MRLQERVDVDVRHRAPSKCARHLRADDGVVHQWVWDYVLQLRRWCALLLNDTQTRVYVPPLQLIRRLQCRGTSDRASGIHCKCTCFWFGLDVLFPQCSRYENATQLVNSCIGSSVGNQAGRGFPKPLLGTIDDNHFPVSLIPCTLSIHACL